MGFDTIAKGWRPREGARRGARRWGERSGGGGVGGAPPPAERGAPA